MQEHLKSTYELTVICFNSFHSFQEFCHCVSSGVDAATCRNCAWCHCRRWNRHVIKNLPVGLQVDLCQLFQHLRVLLSLLTTQVLVCLKSVRGKVGIECSWSCWWHWQSCLYGGKDTGRYGAGIFPVCSWLVHSPADSWIRVSGEPPVLVVNSRQLALRF